jgi:hypothetical protein
MAEAYEDLQLQKSDEVKALMETRHILDDEAKMVIHEAEASGAKVYQEGSDHLLGKKTVGKVTFYVEYSPAGDKIYTVHSAYSHRMEVS